MHSVCKLLFHFPKNKIFSTLSTDTRKQAACRSHTRLFMLGSTSRNLSVREGEVESASEEYYSRDCPLNTVVLADKMPKRRNAKKNNHPKKIQKFAHEDQFEGVSYYFENGLRKIRPYVYRFECHAKGRWFGSKLLDVFKKEFRLETAEYYQKAIQEGLIKVNKGRASPDRILKNNDFMQSKVHRHEPPVTGEPIQILAETEDYLVINKPASIPVHPCGKYRHNTIVFILGKEYGYKGLHTIHRLDRLTSGLLLFARTLEVSHRLDAYVRDRLLEKTYVCKVQGEFPSEPLECNEPIFIVSHKIGVCRVREDGKPCQTRFERLSYDGETSIVKCYPHTGRMHQIRVHLQYLGFPIINDPLYNNTVWGQQRGKGGCAHLSDEELLKDLIEQHDIEIDSALEKARIQVLINKKNTGGIGPEEGSIASEEDNERRTDSSTSVDKTKGVVDSLKKMDSTTSPETSEETTKIHVVGSESHVDRLQINDASESQLDNSEQTSDGQTSKAVPSSEAADPLGESKEASSLDFDPNGGRSEVTAEVSDHDREKKEDERTDQLAVSLCRECKNPMPDPEPHEMCIYLHALTYKGPGFEFSAPMPAWAEEHFARTGTTFSS